jgi:hypothetical protein
VILVTEANEMVFMFGNASAEYWTLTDTSGKLRKAAELNRESRRLR